VSNYLKTAVFIVYCLICIALSAEESSMPQGKRATIELTSGSVITGDVVYEKSEQVLVDLGFTVLTIPRNNIIQIHYNDETLMEKAVTVQAGLLRIGADTEIQSVKDLVDKFGSAVVLVQTPTGLGSGFIVHPDGYVITNDHVIAGEHDITVTLFKMENGGLERRAFQNVRILATSPEQDLALLKIQDADAPVFTTVSIGESDELRQGESVFAIGSPLGLERTVSEGIISLRNRLIEGRLYIQQTAEISPGNSGGPLFNLKGEVIGVNNMKVAATGAEGLGFAIPSTTLKTFIKNRDAFAFDPKNPNAGFRYNLPPTAIPKEKTQ